jgi:AcrR family transcriptional regulator
MTQAIDFTPKKTPSQRRSRETFEAIVQACTGLLPERGYAGTTTNHIAERAGVNIASVYEYFPGKDAIVAQVAERLVERVLARLAEGAGRVMEGGEEGAVRDWIELIHETVARERELVAVFLYQVPYTNQLAPIQDIGFRLLDFSQQIRRHAGDFVRPDFSTASLHLVINLVTSTIMQLVLDPPRDVGRRELLGELVARVEEWIRGPGEMRSA